MRTRLRHDVCRWREQVAAVDGFLYTLTEAITDVRLELLGGYVGGKFFGVIGPR
jgi:hypothetical protein